MGYVGILLGLCIAVVYVYLSVRFLFAAVVPALPVVVSGSAAVGLALSVGLTLHLLTGRDPGVRVLGPAEVVAGDLGGRSVPGLPARDPAWPQYFVAQAGLDLRRVAARVVLLVAGCWTQVNRRVVAIVPWGLLAWPLLGALYAALLALTTGAAVGLLAVGLVFAAVSVAALSSGLLLVGLLRGVDVVRQRRWRSHASCPRCFAVAGVPAFECPGCAELHRDLRPGMLGVLWRRCACGQVLPTTVLRAGAALVARCQVCPEHTALARGAAVATDIRVPVFGPPSAGKSQFVAAALAGLSDVAAGSATEVHATDERTARAYDETRAALRAAAGSIPKTQEATHPAPWTFTLRSGRRHALLHLFDAAGERYVDAAQNAQLGYLDGARTLVFILDPFSIRDLRARLGGDRRRLLTEAGAAEHDPEDAYNTTATRLREFGVATGRQRLAVVVTKADLLDGLPAAQPPQSGSAAVRGWLHHRGLDNLVTAAERDFGEVRYFLVSSVAGPDGTFDRATAPLTWILAGEGFGLSPVGASSGSASPGGTPPAAP